MLRQAVQDESWRSLTLIFCVRVCSILACCPPTSRTWSTISEHPDSEIPSPASHTTHTIRGVGVAVMQQFVLSQFAFNPSQQVINCGRVFCAAQDLKHHVLPALWLKLKPDAIQNNFSWIIHTVTHELAPHKLKLNTIFKSIKYQMLSNSALAIMLMISIPILPQCVFDPIPGLGVGVPG
jgi:hypothetical protein